MRIVYLFLALSLLSLSLAAPRTVPSAAGAGTSASDVKLIGVIDTITAGSLVVAGTTVATNAQTVIIQGSHILTFADLQVGQTVKVNGALQTDGSILAALIRVLPAL